MSPTQECLPSPRTFLDPKRQKHRSMMNPYSPVTSVRSDPYLPLLARAPRLSTGFLPRVFFFRATVDQQSRGEDCLAKLDRSRFVKT